MLVSYILVLHFLKLIYKLYTNEKHRLVYACFGVFLCVKCSIVIVGMVGHLILGIESWIVELSIVKNTALHYPYTYNVMSINTHGYSAYCLLQDSDHIDT